MDGPGKDIGHLDFEYVPFAERAARLIIKPVEGLLPVLSETKGKPLAELTVEQGIAWVLVGAYVALVSIALSEMVINGADVLLRGRVGPHSHVPRIPRR